MKKISREHISFHVEEAYGDGKGKSLLVWRDGQVIYERMDPGETEVFKGRVHRENGPSSINSRGESEYAVLGKMYREDGPAAYYPNSGVCYYCLGGERIGKEEFFETLLKGKE